mmetsp:Transcript_38674/g.119273  ORF Transcript_38674/g.119273 Transcript_38674/m.119273 type:complete len:203 (+) Transcript_38674:74-682(+)
MAKHSGPSQVPQGPSTRTCGAPPGTPISSYGSSPRARRSCGSRAAKTRSCVGVGTPRARPARRMPPVSSWISDGRPRTTSRRVEGVTPGGDWLTLATVISTSAEGVWPAARWPAAAAQCAVSSIAARSRARVSGMLKSLSTGARQSAPIGPMQHMITAFAQIAIQVLGSATPESMPLQVANRAAKRSTRSLLAAPAAAPPSE